MKHVLVVAFHFPPESSSSGVLRTSKFVRYLCELGWRVSVLTVHPRAYAHTDQSLLEDIPASVKIVRTSYFQYRTLLAVGNRYPSFLAIPDIWSGWYPFGVAAGLKHCRGNPVDVVYSTSPHATAHLIGQRIAGRLGVPSVVDFRDPWFEDPPEPGTTWLVARASQFLERRVVGRAAFTITTTPEFMQSMRERYPEIAGDRFVCLPNGFDERDFQGVGSSGPNRNPRLVIVHTGNINPLFRDPAPLIEAFGRQINAGRLAPQEILLRFLGPGDYASDPALRQCIARNGLEGSVEFVERVQYSECVQMMADADLLLLLQASADTVTLVPTKLYEYLRIGRPILALVWRGSSSAVLDELGGGWSCDPKVAEVLDDRVGGIVQSWRDGALDSLATDRNKVQRYDRRNITGDLAALLERAKAARQ